MAAAVAAQHHRDGSRRGGCAAHRGTGASAPAAVLAVATQSGRGHTAAHPRAAAGARTPRPAGFVRPLQGVWSASRLVSLRVETKEYDDMTY